MVDSPHTSRCYNATALGTRCLYSTDSLRSQASTAHPHPLCTASRSCARGTRPACYGETLRVLIYQGHCPCPARANPSLRSGSLLCACNWTSLRFQHSLEKRPKHIVSICCPLLSYLRAWLRQFRMKKPSSLAPVSALNYYLLNEFKVHWRPTTYGPSGC